MFAPSGPIAEDLLHLTVLLVVSGSAVFAGVMAVGAIAGWRRRSDSRTDGSEPDPAENRSPAIRRLIIGGGVILPTVVITAVFAATVETMHEVPTEAPADSLRVQVVGHRWWWEVIYPDNGVKVTDEIHLPRDRSIAVELSSADVVHSFWVPGLGGKMDALPDRTNTLVLQADEVGELRGQCAEFCGLRHSQMEITVVVHSPDGFESWLKSRAGP